MIVEQISSYGSKVYDNRVLRGIFARRRKKVTGGWRNWNNQDLPIYS
jgi:hypothetical protein